MAKDIYTEAGTQGKAPYNQLLDSLISDIDAGKKRPLFSQLVREIESDDNRQASAGTTSAKGVYQFTNATVQQAKQRAKNLGIDESFINLIPNDPRQWTDKEADTMFYSKLFAHSYDEPGKVDTLLEQAIVGEDRSAMQNLYYNIHHTNPDNPTIHRTLSKLYPVEDDLISGLLEEYRPSSAAIESTKVGY